MPNSILKVPIQIEVKRLGEMLSTLSFTILGGSDSIDVELHYNGEGPVISVSPIHLNWGKCPVLTPVKKIITLSNQSVINAEFECVMVWHSVYCGGAHTYIDVRVHTCNKKEWILILLIPTYSICINMLQ